MTNEQMLDDLKQYLDMKLDAQESRLKSHTEDVVDRVVTDRIETVLDALGNKTETVDGSLENHETRIAKLEAKLV